jgi:drug/metabolite transporter (DMT)-like permease
MHLGILAILLLGSLCAAVGQLCFKAGADGRLALVDFINAWILSGLFLYGVGTVLWIYALSRLRVMTVYPFTALTFVMVYCGSYFVFKEKMGVVGISGVLLILAGLLFVALDRG